MIHKRFPTLYSKNSNGSINQWTIEVEQDLVRSVKDFISIDSVGGIIRTTYGIVDGKMQVTEDFVSEGKNAGKKNATDPLQQAIKEAEAKWKKQLKAGYVKTLEEAKAGAVDSIIEGGTEPMLAHRYDKFPHKMPWPAYGSPKLDGMRLVAVVKEGKCTLWSRTRKPVKCLPHIQKAIEEMCYRLDIDELTIDGECYNDQLKHDFEKLISLTRTDEPQDGHEQIQYHIFDIVDNRMFCHRYETIKDLLNKPSEVLKLVPNVLLKDESEMMEQFHEWLNQGYEGLMLRDPSSKYEHKRSYGLLKVKLMTDAEYEIIGIRTGRGKLADCAIFQCKTANGHEFDVKMKGSLSKLAEIAAEPEKYIHKFLTVQYQNETQDGLPRFPVGLRIREDE